ncbi:MAG: recombinase XerD [Pirellula sp.]|nr:recombinase XerD [Pirellula sp.]
MAAAPQARSNLKLPDVAGADLSVDELLLRYLQWADTYYRWNGKRTKEFRSTVEALRLLRQLYGSTPANEFGPRALKTLQAASIEKGWCRRTINMRTNRIRRVFKWGVSEELLPPSVFHALSTVSGLQYGRSAAPESQPTQTVDLADVEAVLPYVSVQVAAMIQLQYHGAMRPAEVTIMRRCDIDMSDPDNWVYRPAAFKTQYLGDEREIYLGKRCQAFLQPFLDRPADVYLFSPQEAEAERNEKRHLDRDPNRTTKVYPCELRQREKRKQAAEARTVKRPKRNYYDVDSYRHAVKYGIRQARTHGVEVKAWCPRQLRHTMATRVRQELGLEAAQVFLGHSECAVTQVYAMRDRRLGLEVARKLG